MTGEIAAIFKYEFFNVLRARWLLFYSLLFAVFTFALARFGGDPLRATAGLLNVVLLVVPMVSILYAAIYWYNSESFTALLLTQPLQRVSVFLATWAAISAALAGSFAVSTGLALLLSGILGPSSFLLLAFGSLLTMVFAGLGLLVACLVADRMKGIGAAFIVWLYLALLHDAVVFVVVSALADYPVELPSMILMAANPIDLARVSLLLSLDLAAMMGYTGRVLQSALSGPLGIMLAGIALAAWTVIPIAAGARAFTRKDL